MKQDELHRKKKQNQDYDSWEHYRQAMRLKDEGPQNQEAAKSYLPSPAEIEERIQDLRWLERKQFSSKLQNSIMMEDCPTIDIVRQMVKTFGLKETKRRIKSFISND